MIPFILYDYPRSSAAYRVRIALNYKGIRFVSKNVHLLNEGGQQHSEWYRKVNPQGLVPSLQVEEDCVLTQSLAILEYLEEAFPEPSLLPAQTEARAYVRMIVSTIVADTHPLRNLRVRKYLQDVFQADEKQQQVWVAEWSVRTLEALEKQLKDYNLVGKYCYRDELTLADLCLIPELYSARRNEISLEAYPILLAIEKSCLNLPAFVKAAPT